MADRFRLGRVFIAGDAAHLFTPTGGLGYNTAVEDAVNLGWKVAAVLKGQAGAGLLGTYEIERRAIAQRNTRFARSFADSLGRLIPPPELEDETPEGEAARRRAGEYFEKHARAEFDIPGITFGGRYDGSPGVISDGTSPPPDLANKYKQTGCPGGRPPHLWLSNDYSLYDTLGKDWTLLRLGPMAPAAEPFQNASAELGLPLEIVTITSQEARDLYAADLALIRPDQIVGWRGNAADDARRVLAELSFLDSDNRMQRSEVESSGNQRRAGSISIRIFPGDPPAS